MSAHILMSESVVHFIFHPLSDLTGNTWNPVLVMAQLAWCPGSGLTGRHAGGNSCSPRQLQHTSKAILSPSGHIITSKYFTPYFHCHKHKTWLTITRFCFISFVIFQNIELQHKSIASKEKEHFTNAKNLEETTPIYWGEKLFAPLRNSV